jgi:hypothetical protein
LRKRSAANTDYEDGRRVVETGFAIGCAIISVDEESKMVPSDSNIIVSYGPLDRDCIKTF